jgi:hypothetical protein
VPQGAVKVSSESGIQTRSSAPRRCARDARDGHVSYFRQPVCGVSTAGRSGCCAYRTTSSLTTGSGDLRPTTRSDRRRCARANDCARRAPPSLASGVRTRCIGGTSHLRRTTRCSHDRSRSSRSNST